MFFLAFKEYQNFQDKIQKDDNIGEGLGYEGKSLLDLPPTELYKPTKRSTLSASEQNVNVKAPQFSRTYLEKYKRVSIEVLIRSFVRCFIGENQTESQLIRTPIELLV